MAQFCFADSGFILKDLPGELLSIFCPPPRYEAEQLECHWLKTRDADLVTPEEVPELDHLMPIYGVLHRTYD